MNLPHREGFLLKKKNTTSLIFFVKNKIRKNYWEKIKTLFQKLCVMIYELRINQGRAIDRPNGPVYYNSINVAQCRLSDIGEG